MEQDLAELQNSFDAMATEDEKAVALAQLIAKSSDEAPSIDLVPSTQNQLDSYQSTAQNESELVAQFSARNGLDSNSFISKLYSMTGSNKLAKGTSMPPPLNYLCCANQQFHEKIFCTNDAVKFCSGCQLVGYCSRECQTAHWKTHKRDCRDRILSEDWKPKWVEERRKPTFVTGTTPGWASHSPYGMNVTLWGNMPAYDILNLQDNEGYNDVEKRDLAIAFIASGDLRNLIRTVNELPNNYSGSLKVVINDHNPLICCRNFLILLILALVPDLNEAAEHALHLWYSVFLPMSYIPRVLTHINQAIKSACASHCKLELTSTTSLTTTFNHQTIVCLCQMMCSQIQPATAENALTKVMKAPERVDYRDRYYSGLRPSHRAAFQEWRSFGLVLPFGAPNAHMNLANKTLFTPDGSFLLNDSASPLQGWDTESVLQSGPLYGTKKEDLMGCLYFYVKGQLLKFTKRLRRFKIDISLYDQDVRDLRPHLDSSVKFDRIEVSNITDREYIGLAQVLTDWGPFLNPRNEHAAIIGLFMNWFATTSGGKVDTASRDGVRVTMEKAMGCFSASGRDIAKSLGNPQDPSTMNFINNLDAFYENSNAFLRYLRDEKAESVAKSVGLEMRKTNKIVPHRLFARLGAPWNSLPNLSDTERLYQCTSLSMVSTCERYVEWTRKRAGK